MDTPEISIIVTVYNAERYLSRCLDSIIAQTFKNFEIILVNDGSTDNSMDVINRYANNYKNIKVVVQKNMGAACARHSGVKAAIGNYIMQMDSDDWLPENSIDLLYDKCIKYDLDYVKGVHYSYYSENCKPIEQYSPSGVMTGDEFLNYLTRPEGGLSLWGALCKRSIWQQDVFPDTNIKLPSEDFFISIKLAMHIKRAGIFNDIPVYYYFINTNSLSTSSHIKSQSHWALYYIEIRKLFTEYNLLEDFEEKIRIFELHNLAFHVKEIDTNSDWYKKICSYDPSKYPLKYKTLHYLIKHPDLCKYMIDCNRKLKRFKRWLNHL